MEPDTRSNKDLVDIISITSTEPSMETRNLELPEELSKNVVVLTCKSTVDGGSCDVYLIGTTHISQESCREVEAIIRFLKPQVVFLELCSSRVSLLEPCTSLEVPKMSEMVEMWKNNQNAFDVALGYLQAKIASKVEVASGAEFRVAYEEAKSHKSKVILGDRPVEITLQRIWAKMSLWYKLKFLLTIMCQSFFFPNAEELEKTLKEIKNKDTVSLLIEQLGKEFPSLTDTLVHERDQYMASKLLEVAREKSLVVGVVGIGHLQGIKNNWKQPINRNDLLEIPTNQSVFTVKKILISLATIAAVVAFWCKS